MTTKQVQQRQLFSLSSIALILTIILIVSISALTVGISFPQLIPIPAAALIINIFFGRQLAILITFLLLIWLMTAGAINNAHAFSIATACTAAIAGYSKQRHDLVFTGLIIAFAQMLGFIIASVFAQPAYGLDPLGGLLKLTVLEFVGGLVSSILAIGSLPFLENLFGLLTPFRLSELTNSDQPLLRKLEMDAPGTYQHSLAVANLAEAGAHAISADANLTRVGALYHDLGKALNPKYFIENQLGNSNPHEELTPEQSREKILDHVKSGIDLAARYGLPTAIIDFIPMHQGTTIMAYFYHKACQQYGADKVDPEAYRYPGPKPKSKETAIVMLADVAEAVTHSMKDPTLEEIDSTLSTVFENRRQDGQLNQSTLTDKELQRIKAAFVRVWRTLHHDRLKYPTTNTGTMPIPPQIMAYQPEKQN